jgi:hypothetical protein
MIIAKLTQPILKTYSSNILNPVTISGSYFLATTQEYVLGAPTSSFMCRIGNLEFDSTGSAKFFKDFARHPVRLTSDELSSWGTDDTACLEAIIAKLGLEVEEYLDLDIPITL